ncbi:hypothetical protein ACFV6E_13745 [Streptomyces sp. NPDC059785]
MNDHGAPKPQQDTPPLWRRLGRQTALGAAGALGATVVAWLKAWLEGHRG